MENRQRVPSDPQSPLAINFIFAGAQHRNDAEQPVILFRAANEFVLPARLALERTRTRRLVDSTLTSRATELLSRFSSPGSGSTENCSVFAPASPGLNKRRLVLRHSIAGQCDLPPSENLPGNGEHSGCDRMNVKVAAHVAIFSSLDMNSL